MLKCGCHGNGTNDVSTESSNCSQEEVSMELMYASVDLEVNSAENVWRWNLEVQLAVIHGVKCIVLTTL
ncbi:hypothetical protein ANANG_G00153820 [Anguilla anguilla]|uniref:Uncharacterized protein n=1 Tax=Anguilla anguilla TaxID=7936 RepID=A0A9D3M766_ANGAN|nr:hypothetical protein ANANG_G00153820 [Anguilla anguilla]